MVSQLISLPLRIGARAARLSLSTAEEALRLTADLAGQAIQAARPEQAAGAGREPAAGAGREPAETSATEAAPTRPAEPRPMAAPREPSDVAAQPSEPAHVSTEATVVEERAEPGAEDGAGAEVHVDEPWPEYERLEAADIVARLERADPAELAAVELYERTHRARQTVLTAAEDRLRIGGGSGRQT